MSSNSFDAFFEKATGCVPFPFQRDFAHARALPQLVCVPTGLGKTAMTVVGWLWRRFGGNPELKAATPPRLVYCLPVRVLVEQTRECALKWLNATGLRVGVHVLMGGEEVEEWDLHPEREAIIIGTQDMLVSRALNRGYATSRSRWPIQFGLLNTDCLWIFDEIQLMGAALATTAQLEAFRRLLPREDAGQARNSHRCRSVWMSATMKRDWLETVDFKRFLEGAPELTFDFQEQATAVGPDGTARKILEDRWMARKPLNEARAAIGDVDKLAKEILTWHKDRPGTRTIVVVNTVQRACELHDRIGKQWGSADDERLVLLHSRFRPGDRENAVKRALTDPPDKGTIVVSTQIIEAGVDVSATTLFTELAPWASLVQRFGRCNRRGEADGSAAVRWMNVPDKDAPPYEEDDLQRARTHLRALEQKSVGLEQLDAYVKALSEDDRRALFKFEHTHVIRRKDLIDLFDTTPDLAGNDIDIDRFVREIEQSDVRVFWRDYDTTPNETDDRAEPAPRREELCPAPIGEFKQFARDGTRRGKVWRWNFLDKKWENAAADRIAPGQVFLIHVEAAGYSPAHGWDPKSAYRVSPVPLDRELVPADAIDADPLCQAPWQTIAEHTEEVCQELDASLAALQCDSDEANALRIGARWHDWGKVHPVFQNAVDDGQVVQRKNKTVMRRERPNGWSGCRFVAKAPDKLWKDGRVVKGGWWRRYDWPAEGRRHFRHELASALAVLDPKNGQISDDIRDLAAYLVAAHHGKVRLSIRSLPNETRPRDSQGKPLPERRFARGVWDGDSLPEVELGGGVTAPALTLSLEPMELGLCEYDPFASQPSWAERMLRLRDSMGPFRLAYLEAILRAADMRASKSGGTA